MTDTNRPHLSTSGHIMSRLPLDVSRCLGRVTLKADEETCTIRDTCRRYRAMLSDKMDEDIPFIVRTDDGGACDYYMEFKE